MILLDSVYINNSGGLHLLEFLVKELQLQGVQFKLLADSRCDGFFLNKGDIEYIDASLYKRGRWYLLNKEVFSCVICFGNIPTPIKLDVPVYTYFHNINLLTLSETRSFKDKVVSWMKREVFRYLKDNTDFWLVQTTNTANELVNHLKEEREKVKLMPFYELPDELSALNNQPHGDDYVFISTYVPGKGHEELLDAWEILHSKGYDRTLHLTVPLDCHPFLERIKESQGKGVRVENHGLVPFDKVIDLYGKSKAIVYPSHNESLGLGIVEAITAGCDVIGSDLPFLHSICKPSGVFNPYSAESIAEAVLAYESSNAKKSELTIYNHIDELVKLLTN